MLNYMCVIGPVVDKDYTFVALCDGYTTDVTIHLTLVHDQVMVYGKSFSEMSDNDIDEISDSFIKGILDEREALVIAQSFFEEREQDEEEKTIEDFFDKAYDYLGCYYYGYCWSAEFKNDCVAYYLSHR